MGPKLKPPVQVTGLKFCRARKSRRRWVVMSGDRKPGMTITGWPLPRAASSGKGGGDSAAWVAAITSRARVVAETRESEGGQMAKPLKVYLSSLRRHQPAGYGRGDTAVGANKPGQRLSHCNGDFRLGGPVQIRGGARHRADAQRMGSRLIQVAAHIHHAVEFFYAHVREAGLV